MKNKISIALFVFMMLIVPLKNINAKTTYTMSHYTSVPNSLDGFWTKAQWYVPGGSSSNFIGYKTMSECADAARAAGGNAEPEYGRMWYYHYLSRDYYQITCQNSITRETKRMYLYHGYSSENARKKCSEIVEDDIGTWYFVNNTQRRMDCPCNEDETISYGGYNYCPYREYGYSGCLSLNDTDRGVAMCTIKKTWNASTGYSQNRQYNRTAVATNNTTKKSEWAFCISPGLSFPDSNISTAITYESVDEKNFRLSSCSNRSSANYDKFACGIAAIMLTAEDRGYLNYPDSADKYAAILTALRLWAANSSKHGIDLETYDGFIPDSSDSNAYATKSPIYKTTADKVDAGYVGDNSTPYDNVIYAEGSGDASPLWKLQEAIRLYRIAVDTVEGGANAYNFPETISEDGIMAEPTSVSGMNDNGTFEFYIETNFDQDHFYVDDKSISSNTSGVSLSLVANAAGKYLFACPDNPTKNCVKVSGYNENYKKYKYCKTDKVSYTFKYKTDTDVNAKISLIQSVGYPNKYQRFITFNTSTTSNVTANLRQETSTREISIPCPTSRPNYVCPRPSIDYSGEVNTCEDTGRNIVVSAEVTKSGVISKIEDASSWYEQKTSLEFAFDDRNYEGTNLTADEINAHRLTSSNFESKAVVTCENKYCNVDITNTIKNVEKHGTTPTSDGKWYVPVKYTIQFTLADGKKESKTYYSVGSGSDSDFKGKIASGPYKYSYRVLVNALPDGANNSTFTAIVTSAAPFNNSADASEYIKSKNSNELTYITGGYLKTLPTPDEVIQYSLTSSGFNTSVKIDCGTSECTATVTNTYKKYKGVGTGDNSKTYVSGVKAKNVWYIPIYYKVKFTYVGGATATKTYYSVGFVEEEVIKANLRGKSSYDGSYMIKLYDLPTPDDATNLDSRVTYGTTGFIKDPTLECIVNSEDLSPKYDFTDTYSVNKYCSVKCREDITLNMFDKETSKTVNYLQYKNGTFSSRNGSQYLLSNIVGERECVTLINYQQWKTDWNAKNNEVIAAWNEFKKYENYRINTTATSEKTEDSAPEVCDDSCWYDCGSTDCGCDEYGNGCGCCWDDPVSSCAGPVSRTTYIWTWPEKYYASMVADGTTYLGATNYIQRKNNRTYDKEGTSASCSSSCSSAGCSGESGNPEKYTASYATAVNTYIQKINEREVMLQQIQDCNLYINLQLHKNSIQDSTNGVYLLGKNSTGNGSTPSCNESNSSCDASATWASNIGGITSVNHDSLLYYKLTAGYAFDPYLTYDYDSIYNEYIEISNKDNTNYGVTELLYPKSVYSTLADSSNKRSLLTTKAVPDGILYCADKKTSGYIDYANKYTENYWTEGICRINRNSFGDPYLTSSKNFEDVIYWNCHGSGNAAICDRKKVTVPINNMAMIKVKKKTNFYQKTEFYASVPDGNILVKEEPNSIKLTDKNDKKNIFPIEMDRRDGEYDALAKYYNLGDANRKTDVKFKYTKNKPGTYICPYGVENDITINTYEHEGYGFYFRTIDLKDVLPSGTHSGRAWDTNINRTIKDGRTINKLIEDIETKNNAVYNEVASYKFVITPKNIKNIKNFNVRQEITSNGFNDYSNLDCNHCTDEYCVCTSNFLKGLNTNGALEDLVTCYMKDGVIYNGTSERCGN